MEQSIISIGKENEEKMDKDEYQITAFYIKYGYILIKFLNASCF